MPYKLTFEDGHSAYLEHFGIKGMHWGVWNDETRARRMGTSNKTSNHSRAVDDFKMGSADYQKRLTKIGYSDKQAKQIAKSREWYKKAAIGALTIAAVGGAVALGSYAVRKYGVKTLKAGSILQTVHAGDIAERIGKESFYASYTKADNAIYKGFFGRAGTNITKLAAKQDIKIAPEAHAHKIFMETVKENPRISYLENGKEHSLTFRAYLLKQGINPDKASSLKTYRAFNHDLVHKSKPIYNAAHEAFYKNMKAKGYGALTDSYNAFGTHGYSYRPIIVFGDVKFDVAQQSVVSAASHMRNFNVASLVSSTRPSGALTGNLAVVGATAAAMVGVSENKVQARENFAKQYKKDHPNTPKTDAQIKRMYDSKHPFEGDPYK